MVSINRAIIVMAHPDDVEISCYGILNKLSKQGAKCYIVIASNGENGLRSSNNVSNDLLRKTETQKALLNIVEKIIWLELNDGCISFDLKLINCIEDLLKTYNPQLVITHYPDNFGIEHQDHSTLGKATINAALRCCSQLNFLLLAEPLIYNITDFKPNCFVDISDYYERKKLALSYHETQKEKLYMNSVFQNIRSYSTVPYINFDLNYPKHYERFQIIYSKI